MSEPSPSNHQPGSGQLSRSSSGQPPVEQDPAVEAADGAQNQDDTTGHLLSWGITAYQSAASQPVRSGSGSDRCATGKHFPEATL
jgi:hypothetical protein